MLVIKKHPILLKIVVMVVALAFATAGFSANTSLARIIPSGKVFIIKNGKVIGEFSQEAPLPEGALLRCQGRCTVKMNDLYVVAEPDTVFSVQPMATRNELVVKQGTAYFSVSETSRPLTFKSPAGNAAMDKMSVTGNALKGYMQVSGNQTEIGVIEGGTMIVETASGEMFITPGNQVTLALADPAAENTVSGTGEGSGLFTNVALGAAGAGVIIAGGIALSKLDWGDGSNGSGSPSSP